MAFGAFQISGFQRNAFQILTGGTPTPTVLLPKGGLKKERTHNRSFRQTVKESLHALLDEPKIVEGSPWISWAAWHIPATALKKPLRP